MIKTVLVALMICVIEFLVIVIASPLAKPSLVLLFLPEDIKEAAKDHPEPSFGKLRMIIYPFICMVIAGICSVCAG